MVGDAVAAARAAAHARGACGSPRRPERGARRRTAAPEHQAPRTRPGLVCEPRSIVAVQLREHLRCDRSRSGPDAGRARPPRALAGWVTIARHLAAGPHSITRASRSILRPVTDAGYLARVLGLRSSADRARRMDVGSAGAPGRR